MRDFDELFQSDNEALSEFFGLMKEAQDPCPESDCEDLTCLSCSSIIVTVPGTLPLEVKCTGCGKVYLLKDILESAKNL